MSANTVAKFTLPFPNPRTDEQRQSNFIASSASIVGAVWDTRHTAWWIPRGLERFNDPKNPLPGYRSPFFGAEKEWENDDQGWTTVSHKRSKAVRRRRARRLVMEDDESVIEE